MSWLSKNFTGTNKNPADAANSYLDQIPGQMNPYFQPYIDQGRQSGDRLNTQYDQMTQNPGEFFNQISSGYKQSPGYQYKLQQALSAGQNASAAGGQLGTPQDQQQQMGLANDIASKDYEDYINHILGIFGQGQQGQQEFQKQGFGASTQYGENLANVTGQKAQNAYAGQAGENARRSQNWSNLAQIGAALAGGGFGGGAGAFGGSNTGGRGYTY